jgi:hypothetical protein
MIKEFCIQFLKEIGEYSNSLLEELIILYLRRKVLLDFAHHDRKAIKCIDLCLLLKVGGRVSSKAI